MTGPLVAVAGAGSFGTAVATLLATCGNDVILWARDAAIVDGINQRHRNPRYFPQNDLSHRIRATADLRELAAAPAIFLGIPSSAIGPIAADLAPHVAKGTMVINLAKGLDAVHETLDRRIAHELPGAVVASLKGPTFSRQIINGHPVGFTFASSTGGGSEDIARYMQAGHVQLDSHPVIRDVELMGALKNVYAIAMGICSAMDNSENCVYLVLTRIIRELYSVLEGLGASPAVMQCYCGAGDFLLTTLSNQSRNRTLGYFVGLGFHLDASRNGVVTEGMKALNILSAHLAPGQAPILSLLKQVLSAEAPPAEFFERLTVRPMS